MGTGAWGVSVDDNPNQGKEAEAFFGDRSPRAQKEVGNESKHLGRGTLSSGRAWGWLLVKP